MRMERHKRRRDARQRPRASRYPDSALWRRWSDHHRRSRVEPKMHRMKLLGHSLVARGFDRQGAEIQIRIAVPRRYTTVGTHVTQVLGQVLPERGSTACNRSVQQSPAVCAFMILQILQTRRMSVGGRTVARGRYRQPRHREPIPDCKNAGPFGPAFRYRTLARTLRPVGIQSPTRVCIFVARMPLNCPSKKHGVR